VGHPAIANDPVEIDFTTIFEAHLDYVWNTLRRLGVRERDLEDEAHELFLRVHRRFDTYDPRRPVRPWLFVFALHAAADYRRLARHRVDLVDDTEAIPDATAAPDEQLLHREELDQAARLLAELELDRRAIFVLHEIDGIPVPEAARILEIGVNTAYSRLRLAREDFAAAVKRLRASRGGVR
jgi:RNA polymerase sigma-70 factor (ECF subfamily)